MISLAGSETNVPLLIDIVILNSTTLKFWFMVNRLYLIPIKKMAIFLLKLSATTPEFFFNKVSHLTVTFFKINFLSNKMTCFDIGSREFRIWPGNKQTCRRLEWAKSWAAARFTALMKSFEILLINISSTVEWSDEQMPLDDWIIIQKSIVFLEYQLA